MNPLHQFEVAPVLPLMLGDWNFTVTNQALWTGIAVAAVITLFTAGIMRMRLVPGRTQAFVELTVEFIMKLTKDVAGKDAIAFLPFVLTLFLFISCLNLIGMLPHAFTATSQITTTAFMGWCVIIMVIATGFYKRGLHFLGLFLPHGTPLWLAPLIIPLELISFFARPFTLAIRLAANMVAGHILMKLFAAFCIMLLGLEVSDVVAPNAHLSMMAPAAILPVLVLVAISALELFVALLQAYIFTVLTCVYLNDALHGH